MRISHIADIMKGISCTGKLLRYLINIFKISYVGSSRNNGVNIFEKLKIYTSESSSDSHTHLPSVHSAFRVCSACAGSKNETRVIYTYN